MTNPTQSFDVTLFLVFKSTPEGAAAQGLKKEMRLPAAPSVGLTLEVGSDGFPWEHTCRDITLDVKSGSFMLIEQVAWDDLAHLRGAGFVEAPEIEHVAARH